MRRAARTLPLALVIGLAACAVPEPYDGDAPRPKSLTRSYGSSAEITTRDIRFGVPVTWEVRVDKPTREGEALCFPVTLTVVEVGEFERDVSVALPKFTPVAGELEGNYMEDSVCSLDDAPVTGHTPDLTPGREFATAVASWTGDGLPPDGLRVSTPEQTVTFRP